MKQNYWKYIVIGLLSFVIIFHLGAIWHIVGQRFELTSADYYEQDRQYQNTIDALEAAAAFKWRCQVDPARTGFELRVHDEQGEPVDLSAVELRLYRPNDASQDLTAPLAVAGAGHYRADLPLLADGRWRITVVAERDGQTLMYREETAL